MHRRTVDNHTIGARIRERRQRLGMTQEDLGRHLGVGATAVSMYETGRNAISAPDMATLALALSVDVGYFYDTTPVGMPVGYDLLDDDQRAMFDAMIMVVHRQNQQRRARLEVVEHDGGPRPPQRQRRARP